MSRQALRRLIFGILLSSVVVVVVQNVRTNERLLSALQSEEENVTARAFAELLSRPDRVNLVQTLPITARQKIARRLAGWDNPEAVRLAGDLLQDPEPEVRQSLTESLVSLARRFPNAYATQLSAIKPEVIAGLIEAAERAGDVGLTIAEQAFRSAKSRENAGRLFLRLGQKAKGSLLRLLHIGDMETSIFAAEVLSKMPRQDNRDFPISRELYLLYQKCENWDDQERLLFALSVYPPAEAVSLFKEILVDPRRPEPLRSACASALVRLGADSTLWGALKEQSVNSILLSPAILREVGIAFAEKGENGVRRVLQCPLEDRVKAMLLQWNSSDEAEAALVSLAKKGVDQAFSALMERALLTHATYAFLYELVTNEEYPSKYRWMAGRCLALTPRGQAWLRFIPPTAGSGYWIAQVALDEAVLRFPSDPQGLM